LTLQLLKQWGREGFHRHVAAIKEFYMKQRDAMISAAETHLTGYLFYFKER
jgi:DNA-binding transcriptional MocR family regulator